MSIEQDYFPPNGTQFKWEQKSIKYDCWKCNILPKLYSGHIWPARIFASVNLVNGLYEWKLTITNWKNKDSYKKGSDKDPLAACLKAEKEAISEGQKLFPSWVIEALANKWRPPAQDNYCTDWPNK